MQDGARLRYSCIPVADSETQKLKLRLLETKGWRRLDGDHWISPYTQIRYDTHTALDVEHLRHSFTRRNWKELLG